MLGWCKQCGKGLNRYNTGKLCHACQEKRREEDITSNDELIDAEGYAYILGLDNPESVKRLARKDKLAPRVPAVRKWLWRKDDVDAWRKQEGQTGNRDFRIMARRVASNLRVCHNPLYFINPSDKIGDRVYGVQPREYAFGLAAGQVEPVELLDLDRSEALNMLKQLPGEDFPELTGIADWADLTYGGFDEDMIIRLEAYF